MLNSMKDNGYQDSSMGMVSGKELKEIPMLVSGNLERLMVKVYTHG